MKVERRYKYRQIDKNENKKSTGFDKYKNRYISLFLFLFQIELNRPLNLGEKIKSLTQLISITKKKSC